MKKCDRLSRDTTKDTKKLNCVKRKIGKRYKNYAERIAYNLEVVNQKGALSDEYVQYKLQQKAKEGTKNKKQVLDQHLNFNLQYHKTTQQRKKVNMEQNEILREFAEGLLMGPTAKKRIYMRAKMVQDKKKTASTNNALHQQLLIEIYAQNRKIIK
eukprot:TRINITY_DN955_c0_g1_i1.p5 TRINITY_DN955_c0_g1~~TRINITY_DN955_c0_g1_i1.p5  ORF type:complete len:156 (-),score=21.17 TRINITY_DN955_c0_g1_i1:1174-1641(-)